MERETQENSETIKKRVASRILEVRTIRNLPQRELAEKLDIDVQTISLWERCNHLPKSLDIFKICQVLGCSADYIIGLTDTTSRDLEPQQFELRTTRYIHLGGDIAICKRKKTLYLILNTFNLKCLELSELLSIHSGENPVTAPILINKLCQKYTTNNGHIEIPLLSYFID